MMPHRFTFRVPGALSTLNQLERLRRGRCGGLEIRRGAGTLGLTAGGSH